jgi:hypothetical protein
LYLSDNRCHDNAGEHASFSSYISRDKRKAWILTPADATSCNQSFISGCPNIGNTCQETMFRKGVPCSVQAIWISFGVGETSIWQSTGSNCWYAFVNLEYIHTKLIIVTNRNITNSTRRTLQMSKVGVASQCFRQMNISVICFQSQDSTLEIFNLILLKIIASEFGHRNVSLNEAKLKIKRDVLQISQ